MSQNVTVFANAGPKERFGDSVIEALAATAMTTRRERYTLRDSRA